MCDAAEKRQKPGSPLCLASFQRKALNCAGSLFGEEAVGNSTQSGGEPTTATSKVFILIISWLFLARTSFVPRCLSFACRIDCNDLSLFSTGCLRCSWHHVPFAGPTSPQLHWLDLELILEEGGGSRTYFLNSLATNSVYGAIKALPLPS